MRTRAPARRPLTETGACARRRHCSVCRDRDGGRWLREAWGRLLDLPGGVDFDCPIDLPWGFEGVAPDATIPEKLRVRRQAICKACEHYGEKCGLYGGSCCRWKMYLTLPLAVCPADPPRWLPEKP